MRDAILNLIFTLAMMSVAGCAANQPEEADVCPPNKTLVCEHRMGQTEECACRNKAEMRDVFDLSRSR